MPPMSRIVTARHTKEQPEDSSDPSRATADDTASRSLDLRSVNIGSG